ncbi:MAG: thiamine pyrophosphate-dependent dehydrogenase E1 component subunit alpha [Bacillota bacterium]
MAETLSREKCMKMYRLMRLIRRFEEWVVDLVNSNEITGTTHEYVGEEAVAVGVCSALCETDVITSTHRGHGHIIAKGGDVRRMMAELMGRTTGYNKGRGGSMHIADLSLGIYGANGIVGAGTPIAVGAAWACRAKGAGDVAVAFFGDGAMNQGVVHEAMNLAAIWKLPVVFVLENNLYAASTPIGYASVLPDLARRAEAYGFPGEIVDGMDVEAVYSAASRAVARARRGGGPTLLECKTYRYVGHFTAERALNLSYRTEDEVAAWRARDPIEGWAEKLRDRGVWDDQDRAAVDESVEAQLREAVEFARSSPWPGPADALLYVYATEHEGVPAKGWF